MPFDTDVLIVSEAGSGHGIWSIVPMTIMKKKSTPKKTAVNATRLRFGHRVAEMFKTIGC